MGKKAAIKEDKEDKLIRRIKGKELEFTHLNKIYWQSEGITKGALLNYYERMAPYILPYLESRPQTLHRFPDGIEGPHFYQKNLGDKIPGWVRTFPYQSESEKKELNFLVCMNEASLLYMVQLGCIEMNPWHSRISHPDRPDWCVIDLDPGDNEFKEVIELAHCIKRILELAGTECFCKTSGATGLHIYIPLGARYGYEDSRRLAKRVAELAHDEMPDLTSLERDPEKRKRKIYLDYLQNRNIQTVAAPYSLRPRPGAPVSTPLYWEELKKGLTPGRYNFYNIFDRLKREGDLFRGVLGKGIHLEKLFVKLG